MMEIRNIRWILLSFSLLWVNTLLAQGTVRPEAREAPMDQQEFHQPGEFKPRLGQGGNPGFFTVDRDGKIQEGGPETAGGDKCWGAAEVQGLNGPLMCCPDKVMGELRRKQKLQCLQPGQDPRELTRQELADLQFEDGRPVAEAAEDCKPFVCDQNCDQQQPANAQGLKEAGDQRRKWAMEGDGDGNESVEERETKELVASRNAEIARQQAILERAEAERKAATADRERAENALRQMGKSGQKTPAGQEKKAALDAARTREAKAKQTYRHIMDWMVYLRNANTRDENRINQLRSQRNAGMPKPEDSYDPKAREKFCQMNPDQCPELQRYRKFGAGKGKGRGIDTWVVNPKPEDAGGGAPVEDTYGEASQFLCIPEGEGLGESGGLGRPDQGGGEGGEASGEVEGCPGGARPEGGGGFGGEGQAQKGPDVVENCNAPRPRLPGDDVINPGDPTFFQCPEMGCPNQKKSSITMNNCPDNSIIGRLSKMSCKPYNGPAGVIDPAE